MSVAQFTLQTTTPSAELRQRLANEAGAVTPESPP